MSDYLAEYLIVKNKKSGNQYKINLFLSYMLEQSLKIPADYFHFTIANNKSEVSNKITSGDEIFFYVGGKLALNGIIDDVEARYSISSNEVEIIGRDKSSALLDSDALPKTFYKLNLKQYLSQIGPQYGLTKFEVDDSQVFDKIVAKAGDNEFSIIEELCKKRNLYPRFDIDTFKCKKIRTDTNLDYFFSNDDFNPKSIKFESINIKLSGDYKSEVIAYGGHYSRGELKNKKNIKASIKAPNIPLIKRKVLNDNDLENQKQAEDRAKNELKEINKDVFTIEIETYTKQPFFVNKIAKILVKDLGLDCIMLVDQVQYKKGVDGTKTTLILKPVPGQALNWGNHIIPTIPI